MSFIKTFSGKMINLIDPNIDDVCIDDIAHSLSMQCRFNGHSKNFYSVAQHSVYVSYLCGYNDALAGLLHDASEAYLSDLPKPLKDSGLIPNYLKLENIFQLLIYNKFNIYANKPQLNSWDFDLPSSVKTADNRMLSTELRDFMEYNVDNNIDIIPFSFNIKCWTSSKSEEIFLKRFDFLKK